MNLRGEWFVWAEKKGLRTRMGPSGVWKLDGPASMNYVRENKQPTETDAWQVNEGLVALRTFRMISASGRGY